MKIQHNVNHGWAANHTDPEWAERVEREAERHTEAAAHAYTKAQERLARAVARAEQEQSRKKPDRKKVRRLWDLVEARRQELLALQRLAQSSPAGPQRHRPVPDQSAL